MGIIMGYIPGITLELYVLANSAGRSTNMPHDPMSSVYSFVERAYIRMQAGDLLLRCLDEGEMTPILQMVEGLVLAGPQSLLALREILSETVVRKAEIQDDLTQLWSVMEDQLKGYGFSLKEARINKLGTSVAPTEFLEMLREQNIDDLQTQKDCLQLYKDNRETIASLGSRYQLFGEIEVFLRDWLWGVAFQSIHHETESS
jgi:hypothetical protein